jgi:iron(III) transport system ATP-binding protein
MAFVEIRNLSKRFGRFPALSGVDLSVGEREFVTFLGPSGCGKTTTLRVLAGFLDPDEGAITVAGQVLSSPGHVVPPERRRMGMVFQNYAVWPHMSVFDNVAFGLKIAKCGRVEIRARVEQVLAAVGLEGLEERHPAQLSGGQQQRVALARALVVGPSILLLDEPLSNLDAKLRERMRSELKNLQRRTGITFVYVTHDQAEAMTLSDRIVVLHRGTVQQVGSPREVYERPTNLFVADFMGLVNKLPGTLVERRAGLATVRIASRLIMAVPAPSLDGAATATVVAIRPEAIELSSGGAADGGTNVLEGTITEATFLGNVLDYLVEVGGFALRVQGERREIREIGSRIRLSIPVEECVAMANADQGSSGIAEGGTGHLS